MTREARFWQYVNVVNDAASCWVWTGDQFPNGRARFYLDSEHGQMQAARALWIMRYGDLGSDDLICHKCNNKKCVRPEHIYKGTVATNMSDRRESGSYNDGHLNGRSKLSWDKVRYIRLSKGSESAKSLAHFLEIDPSAISRIWMNKIWKPEYHSSNG